MPDSKPGYGWVTFAGSAVISIDVCSDEQELISARQPADVSHIHPPWGAEMAEFLAGSQLLCLG
jgi:hypothetical protein